MIYPKKFPPILSQRLLALLLSEICLLTGLTPGLAEVPPVGEITAGNDAPEGRYPFVVALLYGNESNPYDAQFCGGVLVHPRWVLTAGHCAEGISPSLIHAVPGAHDLSSVTWFDRIAVEEVVLFTGYNEHTLDNDLALLRLATPAPSSAAVAPLIDDPDLELPGLLVTIIGWGANNPEESSFPSILQEATLEISSQSLANSSSVWNGGVFPTMLPLRPLDGVSTCVGDSGSPSLVFDPELNKFLVAGITSFGRGDLSCGDPLNFPVHTRISKFRDWVLSHTDPAYAQFERQFSVKGKYRDPDGDDAGNWAEFARGSDPTVPDVAPVNAVPGGVAQNGDLPALEMPAPPTNEVAYTLETTADLNADWIAAGVEPSIGGAAVGTPHLNRRMSRLVSPSAFQGSQFLRVSCEPSGDLPHGPINLSWPGSARHTLGPNDLQDANRAGCYYQDFQFSPGLGTNTSVTLTMRSAVLDSYLQVFSADDLQNPLASNNNSGGGGDARISFTAARGGHYLIRASTSSPGQVGEYQLTAFNSILTGLSLNLNTRQGINITSFQGADPLQLPDTHFYKDYWVGQSSAKCLLAVIEGTYDYGTLTILNAESHLMEQDVDTGWSEIYFRPRGRTPYLVRASTWEPNTPTSAYLGVYTIPEINFNSTQSFQLSTTDRVDPLYRPDVFYIDDYVLPQVSSSRIVYVGASSNVFGPDLYLINGKTGGLLDNDWVEGGSGSVSISARIYPGDLIIIAITSWYEQDLGSYTLTVN